jgi:HD-GYP domain-containing protein (c-di-GMP phosphodiesterase class II)
MGQLARSEMHMVLDSIRSREIIMSNVEWSVPVDPMDFGRPVEFGIVDSEGSSGHHFTSMQSLYEADSLEAEEHEAAFKTDVSSVEARSVQELILRAFPEATTRAIKSAIADTVSALMDVVTTLQGADEKQMAPVWGTVGELYIHASNNTAAALAVIATSSHSSDTSIARRIGEYSANLSFLSVIMSTLQKNDPAVSLQIGMAGLLHDCSLLLNQEWFQSHYSVNDETQRKKYRKHPIESADLINGVPGVPKEVLGLIMETHEQADGSGYPRGLVLGQVRQGSEILNAADAYLSLTQPVRGASYLPSDVIGYLCMQASEGKFCKEAIQLLTRSMSMYPVGSLVELNDQSKAVVIEGNFDAPLRPVVRVLHSSHEVHDLRTAPLSIFKPLLLKSLQHERIPKSRFQEILWRTDRE